MVRIEPSDRMTAARTSRSSVGVLATALNFPLVFIGIVAITTQTDGDQEIALLNLWALWGFLQALLGQVGLATAVLDRLRWNVPAVLARAGLLSLAAGLLVSPFRGRLFPGHERWIAAVMVTAGAVFLIGRLRGGRSLAGDAVSTVVITAGENLVRTSLLLLILAAGRDPIADVAIVGPFLVSIVFLHRRSGEGDAGRADSSSPARIWSGVLAGLPAVAAYAIVPGLTLLGTIDDLDAYSIATSLLRGPLLVATFASAWIVQGLRSGDAPSWRFGLVLPVLLVAQLVVESLGIGLIPGLVIHGFASGTALFLTYMMTLGALSDIDQLGRRAVAATMLAVVVFVVLLRASPSDLVHPFLSLTAAATAIGAFAMIGMREAEVGS